MAQSFQGIPEESPEENENWRNEKGYKKDFLKGGYSAARALQVYNLSQLLSNIQARVKYENLTFVPGYFNDSLTERFFVEHRPQPALLIDMDADIYISAIQPLDWLFQHKLIVPSTIVRYDDWPRIWATHGPAKGTNMYGQARAHYEISLKYGVRWKLVGRQGSLQVVSIGEQSCAPELCNGIAPLIHEGVAHDRVALRNALPMWGAPTQPAWLGTTHFRAVDTEACQRARTHSYPSCALQVSGSA